MSGFYFLDKRLSSVFLVKLPRKISEELQQWILQFCRWKTMLFRKQRLIKSTRILQILEQISDNIFVRDRFPYVFFEVPDQRYTRNRIFPGTSVSCKILMKVRDSVTICLLHEFQADGFGKTGSTSSVTMRRYRRPPQSGGRRPATCREA